MSTFRLTLVACWILGVGSVVRGNEGASGADCGCDSSEPGFFARADTLRVLPHADTRVDSVIALDLYVMALCPYALEAERALLPLVERFSTRTRLRIHYIADVAASAPEPPDSTTSSGGRSRMLGEGRSGDPAVGERGCAGSGVGAGSGPFRSLHGQEEIEESIRQLLIKADWPTRYHGYLLCRARQGTRGDWRQCARAMGLVADSLEHAGASVRGQRLFRENLGDANQWGVDLSPTLFVNGREYSGGYRGFALARRLCAELDSSSWCIQIPVCGRDEDCRGKPGEVSICAHPDTPEASCSSQVPVSFPLRVLNTEACPQCSTEAFLRTTLELFPGARVENHVVESGEGARLFREYGIRALPAFIFGAEFAHTARFARVRSMLRPTASGYVVEPRISTVSYWPQRQVLPGRLVLFLPIWPIAMEAQYLAPWRQGGESIRVRHLAGGELLRRAAAGVPLPAELSWRLCAATALPEIYPRLVAAAAARGWERWRHQVAELGADKTGLERCLSRGGALRWLQDGRSRADSLDLSVSDASALVGNRLLLRRAPAARVAALGR